MRVYEVATAAATILVTAVAMFDSFGRSGWTANGPDAGWYPFWSSALMAGAAGYLIVRAGHVPASGTIFASREGVAALAKLVLPMLALAAFLQYVGLYVLTALYMALFAGWVGRYHWVWVVVLAVGFPLALYFGFEQAFKTSLPKTFLYERGILPF